MREISSTAELIGGYFDPAGKTIVDVGCGTGETARWLAWRGARVIGIDRAEMIAAARPAPRARDGGGIRDGSRGALLHPPIVRGL